MSEQRNIEIGEKLRAARQAKGFTLDDLQQKTKIQKRYLNAIENGDFKQLPGDFYVRAFTKQFAMAVDINPDELLANAPEKVIEPTTDLSNSRTDADNVTRTGIDNEVTSTDKLQAIVPKVIIGILVIVVLVVVWFIAQSVSPNTSSQKSANSSNVSVSSNKVTKKAKVTKSTATKKKENQSPKTKTVKTTIGTGTTSGTTTSFTVTTANKARKVKISSKYRTWLTVTNNAGSTLASEMMQANSTKTITVAKDVTTLTIRSGYALGTTITINKVAANIPTSTLTTRNYQFNFEKSAK
ncbi:helix-turn-helix domain-containing protein [Periweissella beninensis]|uniref:DUF4115 domain-containing protein n=1 Tax=Periweissella beninensis TaxID=504936 RepID=A0ABT0VLY9_9LACO|nr:helix-turn-helix transcriptional regulator [Periweissella beninensis]MBM7544005.1 cytoskeletal protein RodZ [Periweissella beninensis]MCM2437437.1 DUF4115 domain-containing protein [Periweissella beninensis]MCT4396514.1 helix-turn-helix domain-containing protein [Periweissella beninensis]